MFCDTEAPLKMIRLSFFAFAFLAVACTQASVDVAGGSSSIVEPTEPETGNTDAGPAPTVGPRIASVTANGTGCPNDATYSAQIAEDGQSVTIQLHGYNVSVARGDSFSIQDCSIALKISDAAGHAYALASLDASGWASLQGEGMKADETLKYYFQGNPGANVTRVKPFTTGPGADYSFDNVLAPEEVVWSPCGGGRDINVQSRKVLRNNTEKTGYGFIGSETLRLRLASRGC